MVLFRFHVQNTHSLNLNKLYKYVSKNGTKKRMSMQGHVVKCSKLNFLLLRILIISIEDMKKWYGTMIVLLGNKLMKASENYGSHYNAVWIQSLAEISSPL